MGIFGKAFGEGHAEAGSHSDDERRPSAHGCSTALEFVAATFLTVVVMPPGAASTAMSIAPHLLSPRTDGLGEAVAHEVEQRGAPRLRRHHVKCHGRPA